MGTAPPRVAPRDVNGSGQCLSAARPVRPIGIEAAASDPSPRTTRRRYNPGVQLDDRICYCYHVSLRKLVNFARRERPERPSQMSQCLGAGTGCGWCIPILRKIFEESRTGRDYGEGRSVEGLPETADEYAAARQSYLRTPGDKNRF